MLPPTWDSYHHTGTPPIPSPPDMFQLLQVGPHCIVPFPDMFKLVPHVAHTADKWTIGI